MSDCRCGCKTRRPVLWRDIEDLGQLIGGLEYVLSNEALLDHISLKAQNRVRRLKQDLDVLWERAR